MEVLILGREEFSTHCKVYVKDINTNKVHGIRTEEDLSDALVHMAMEICEVSDNGMLNTII